ncbi:HEPN domain-containing protein [Methanobacterium sp. 42_16]|uniref:HEPN domain-containing protein n=1 Tax=Methanobacterium sp. 42_16 TaxID=1641383 RepID=UPI000747C134|nr:HEPN domain-containing protein [Methanobacterium sp. 42_16]KUK72687.1 MAG: hypothetical protein XD90_1778 [Methanobacterium sp. 42_16]
MIKLKSEFKCEKTFNELNPLIRDILDTREDDGTFQSKTFLQFDEFENLLFNHLFEKTNLEKELNNLKISFESIPYLNILKKIDYDDNYFEKFIELLNDEINRLKDLDLKEYSFLFPLNIKDLKCEETSGLTGERLKFVKKKCETLDIFEKLLEPFDIQSIEKKSYYDKKGMAYDELSGNEKILDIVSYYQGKVLKISCDARDSTYAWNRANFRFESFLGFLSFICNCFRLRRSDGRNIDFRFFKVKTGTPFMFDDESDISYEFFLDEDDAEEFKRELSDLTLIDLDSDLKIRNYSKSCNYFHDIIKQIENSKLLEVLYCAFALYYLATSEKKLEYSFFKFWIISEYLIKGSSKRKDEQLLRLIKRIVNFYKKDELLNKRIDFLYKKRNKLVHEGETDGIRQDDRNLSKLIADCLLDFYLYSIHHFKVNNLNDFNFLITNIGKEVNNLDNDLKILDQIKEWKNPN